MAGQLLGHARVDGVLTALIAVGGTLLGSMVTFGFQRITADRTARQGFVEQLRQDRLSAYSAFAAVVMEYRHFEIDRWRRMQSDSEVQTATAAAAHATRTSARTELLRIKLLNSDAQLQELGHQAIESTRTIHRAQSNDDHRERYKKAAAALDAFIEHAAVDVQSLASTKSNPALSGPGQLPTEAA